MTNGSVVCGECNVPLVLGAAWCANCGADVPGTPVDADVRAAPVDEPEIVAEPAPVIEEANDDTSSESLPASTAVVSPFEVVFESVVEPVVSSNAIIAVSTTPDLLRGTRRGSARRRKLLLLAGAGAMVCVIAGGVTVAAMSSSSAQHPVATQAPAQRAPVLPGWSGDRAWAAKAVSDALVVSADGSRIASRTGSTVTVWSAAGKKTQTVAAAEDATLLAGFIGRKSAIVAVSSSELLVWIDDEDAARWPVFEGSTARAAGSGIVVTTPTGDVLVATAAGLAPFASPRAGASPLAVTAEGALQWASARGEFVTASATGSIVSAVTLAAPAPGASITRWLAGGQLLVLVWALPDGSTMAVTHSPVDGTVLAQHPTTGTAKYIQTPGSATAMLGELLIGADGAVTQPAPGFVAAKALGDVFYGAVAAAPTLLTASGVVLTDSIPTIVPYGVSNDGSLIATDNGVLTVYPSTSADR